MKRVVNILLPLATLLIACGGSGQFRRSEPVPDDRQDIPAPKFRERDVFATYFDKQITDQGEQVFDLSRQLRRLFGRPKQAFNVDAFDEVPNSSWFTNRNYRRQLSLEAIAQGPGQGRGPDSGTWDVVSAKVGGATAGFQIVDSKGDRYVLKFDPPGYPEMATGAEVVATNLIYAAGYNTPENQLAYFRPEQLRLDDDVAFTDLFGRQRFMTQSDLDAVLARVHRLPDGRIRTMASKFLSGKILGPFEYDGTRPDDPNDFIPHQHRRELRGLRYIAAWINHYDTKSANSMDVYVEEGGRRYVRHHMMDFGSTLGSQGNEPMPVKVGYENTKDPRQALIYAITLGLYVPPWQRHETEIRYPSVGRFSSNLFNPPHYKPITPNPAFENLTHRDGYWGAKIVMSFSDEQIEAAVASGQYTDPEAAAYLLRTLIERRDKIGRYWFAKMNPLDRFELHRATDGISELCFSDLAVDGGLEQAASTHYRYSVEYGDQKAVTAEETQSPCVPLPSLPASVSSNGASSPLARVTLQTRREMTTSWSKRVWVFVGVDEAGGFQLLGLQREE